MGSDTELLEKPIAGKISGGGALEQAIHFTRWSPLPGVNVESYLFGSRWFESEEYSTNWTLSNLRTDDGLDTSRVGCRIAQIMREYDPRLIAAVAPAPVDFNAEVINSGDLPTTIAIGGGLKIKRGVKADGVRIHPGMAHVISSGGCLTLCAARMIKGSPSVVVAHAGLKSLIDMEVVGGRSKSRRCGSVVDAIIAALGGPDGLVLSAQFGIGPGALRHRLDDPKYGDQNERLRQYITKHWGNACIKGTTKQELAIDLSSLVRAQAVKAKVRPGAVLLDPRTVDTIPGAYHTRLRSPLDTYRNLSFTVWAL
jgi:hypothetical protein